VGVEGCSVVDAAGGVVAGGVAGAGGGEGDGVGDGSGVGVGVGAGAVGVCVVAVAGAAPARTHNAPATVAAATRLPTRRIDEPFPLCHDTYSSHA
jgi:hypothetical protein